MTEKKYRVVISERAKGMLRKHILFLAQVNKKSAIAEKSGA